MKNERVLLILQPVGAMHISLVSTSNFYQVIFFMIDIKLYFQYNVFNKKYFNNIMFLQYIAWLCIIGQTCVELSYQSCIVVIGLRVRSMAEVLDHNTNFNSHRIHAQCFCYTQKYYLVCFLKHLGTIFGNHCSCFFISLQEEQPSEPATPVTPPSSIEGKPQPVSTPSAKCKPCVKLKYKSKYITCNPNYTTTISRVMIVTFTFFFHWLRANLI